MKLYEAMDLFSEFEQEDKYVLRVRAEGFYKNFMNIVMRFGWPKDNAEVLALSIVANVIAADKNITNNELKLFDFLNSGENQLADYIRVMTTKEYKTKIKNAIFQFGEESKNNACMLALSVAAIDGHIDFNECDFISLITD